MDYRIHRPQSRCATTGRTFEPGEAIVSALVREDGGIARLDVTADSWQGPPSGSLAWWRSRVPAKDAKGPTLAPVDVLLDVLEQLEASEDDAALRYLLALVLVRRRVLRMADSHDTPVDSDELVVTCRRRSSDYRIRVVPPPSGEEAALEERLSALLWSGDEEAA